MKNFAEFCSLVSMGKISWRPLRPFQCLECNGDGTVYDPDDPPCPIEGNKMRDLITCPCCRGSGEGTESAWREWYKREKAIRAAERKRRLAEERMRASIKRKLTPAERKFVGL